jgi:hypothetical protein
MLKKHGVEVTEAKAAEMLDIMYFLAKLIVKQNFNATNDPLKDTEI